MTEKKKPVPVRREDRPGHLDPKYAESLRALSEEGRDKSTDRAFIGGGGHHTKDPLAEELGEEAVVAMTSGEDDLMDDLESSVEDEQGGPFVASTGGTEFAEGTDASNPRHAKREPFPKT